MPMNRARAVYFLLIEMRRKDIQAFSHLYLERWKGTVAETEDVRKNERETEREHERKGKRNFASTGIYFLTSQMTAKVGAGPHGNLM